MNRHIDRQGGWAGMLVLLLALLIVAWLYKDALLKYAMVPSGEVTVTRSGSAAERARAPVGGAEQIDVGTATPPPANAIERARGVEDMVKRDAEAQSSRMP